MQEALGAAHAGLGDFACVQRTLKPLETSCRLPKKFPGSTYGYTYYHSWLRVVLAAPPLDGPAVVLGSSLGWHTYWFAHTFSVPARGYE